MDTASRNSHRLPPQVHSALSRYKDHSTIITRWLIRTAKAHKLPIAGSPNSEYDLRLNEYLTLSIELVSKRGVQPPRSFESRFNSLIKLRTKCWKWYTENMPDQIASNEAHFAFIGKMRQVRKIWFNTPLGYDTPDSDKEPAIVSCFSMSFAGYRDSADSDDGEQVSDTESDMESDTDTDTDTESDSEGESESENDDLSELPLSAFRLLSDVDEEEHRDVCDTESESDDDLSELPPSALWLLPDEEDAEWNDTKSESDEDLSDLPPSGSRLLPDGYDAECDDEEHVYDSESESESEDDDDDLSALPLSTRRLLSDKDDAESDDEEHIEGGREAASIKDVGDTESEDDDDLSDNEDPDGAALWIHFQELEDYRNEFRGRWEERARAGSLSRSLLTYLIIDGLTQRLVIESQAEELHSLLENTEYCTILRAVLGPNANDDIITLNPMRSFFMIDTWTVLCTFHSMTEEAVRNLVSYPANSRDKSERNEERNNLLMSQLCRWRVRDAAKKKGKKKPCWDSPITIEKVFQFELHKHVLWLDRGTRDPLKRLRQLARLVIVSVQNWIDTHKPEYYGKQAKAKELARKMRNVVAYANTIFAGERRAILEGDPISRAKEEYHILQKSWEVGKSLITDSSRHPYLTTVMSLYLHLRKYSGMPKMDAMEGLRKFMVRLSGNRGALSFPGDIASLHVIPAMHGLTPMRWIDYAIALLGLDGFTIERMAFAVLRELHRTCKKLLRPYMRDRPLYSITAPSYAGLVDCFIEAWRDGPPTTVQALALRGRHALEYGHSSVFEHQPSA
ncbi:hypothetical protein C8R44DRAFT_887266 [Mycena epipterygia]|nr:hypothetical protein C8R44DRAFT_887266 [Mycena epipterygia]